MIDVRVNVGCGATPTPGWVNFDNSWTVRAERNPLLRAMFALGGQLRGKEAYLAAIREHGVRWADASQRIPLPSGSAAVVYSSHMVEHLTRGEAHSFFAEARRVLHPDGILRIAVPDIDFHIREYAAHKDADRFIDGLLMTAERPENLLRRLRHTLVGERQHQWMYSGVTLSKALERAGFVDARIYPAGGTGILDPGALDLSERAPESVFVEARRPS